MANQGPVQVAIGSTGGLRFPLSYAGLHLGVPIDCAPYLGWIVKDEVTDFAIGNFADALLLKEPTELRPTAFVRKNQF
jgi:hypothetical protein